MRALNLRLKINKFFFKKKEKLLDKVIFFPLELLSYLYTFVILIKNLLYDFHIFSQVRINSFVISVGNITVGGSGKTPVVIALANYLSERGYTVGVVTRSYRNKSGKSHFLLQDIKNLSAVQYGDEPVLIKKRLKNVPVACGKNKTELALQLYHTFSPDVIILDDGFSHRRLHRDFDIIMMDEENPTGNGYLIPRGPLREPISSLRRAHAILYKSLSGKNTKNHQLRDNIWSIPSFQATIKLGKIVSIMDESMSIQMGDSSFIAFCGIGNAESFKHILYHNNLNPADFIEFEDHTVYDINIIKEIDEIACRHNARYTICTEKDAVKIIEVLPHIKTKSIFAYAAINAILEEKFLEIILAAIKGRYEDHK